MPQPPPQLPVNPEVQRAHHEVLLAAAHGGILKALDVLPRSCAEAVAPLSEASIAIVHVREALLNDSGARLAHLKVLKIRRMLELMRATHHTFAAARQEAVLLDAICRQCVEVGPYRMAWVGYALPDEGRSITPVAHAGVGRDYVEALHLSWHEVDPRGGGATGRAIRTGEAQLVQNMQLDLSFAPWRQAAVEHGFSSKISLPLKNQNGTFGVLCLYSDEPAFFTIEEEVGLLEDLAADLGLAIATLRSREERDRARVAQAADLERLHRSLEETIQVIVRMVAIRDPYTATHERRVGELAHSLGQAMNLDAERLQGLRFAALIHDLGKIQSPSELLSRPSRLSEVELSLIREHAGAGYEVLQPLAFPWPLADIVHQHHERLDGTGYPQGLVGDEILLEARILAVADVAEAMLSHRPYRPACGLEATLAELTSGRGLRYDAAVVDACVALLQHPDFCLA